MPSSEVMPKFYRRQLRSSSGQLVTNPAQARAIAASEHAAEKANGGVYPEGGKRRRFANRAKRKKINARTRKFK